MVAIYSLKNVYYPEKIIQTDCDVISIAFNPDNENLLLVGLIDGNINLFDISTQKLLAKSSTQTGKHVEAVTCVGWTCEQNNSEIQSLQFVSGGFDGNLIQWSYSLGQLKQLSNVEVYDTGVANDIGPVQDDKPELTNF